MPGVGQDGEILKGVRGGVTKTGKLEQRHEEGEGGRHEAPWGKHVAQDRCQGLGRSMPGMSGAQCGKSSVSRKVQM